MAASLSTRIKQEENRPVLGNAATASLWIEHMEYDQYRAA
jgi:hypothetical protein